MHPCITVYNLSHKPIYGTIPGVCRITGLPGKGIKFTDWVKDTFTDLGYMRTGTIISNEALFCFEESSEYLRQLTGRDKPQRFRTYSHFVVNGQWHLKHKGQKEDMMNLMLSGPDICVISESGQKHIFFKHKPGTWQLEEITIRPNRELFRSIQQRMYNLSSEFTNDEIETGQYLQHRIIKFGFKQWRELEDVLKLHRGTAMFGLALFFSKINYSYE